MIVMLEIVGLWGKCVDMIVCGCLFYNVELLLVVLVGSDIILINVFYVCNYGLVFDIVL